MADSNIKKVCFFGIYDRNYARNIVLRRAFEENNYEIVDCNVDPKIFNGYKKYLELLKLYKTLKYKKFEYVIVCFPGHSIVWLARVLFGKGIIFDAFLSLYDSNVYDRKLYSRFHPKAVYDWLLDWSSCMLANKVLLDTYQHIDYFNECFFVPKNKLIRFLISADEKTFFPQENKIDTNNFIVHFHGMFIPLQGIKYILDCANILKNENIVFKILGNGQEFKKMKKYKDGLGLSNVEFVGKIPFEEVPNWIAASQICLGIFGDTNKAKRVIPNKLYEYIAMEKPVITADTPAIREVFTHGENMILCNSADGKSIAESILFLKSNENYRDKIKTNSYKIFNDTLRSKILGRQLLIDINNG